MEVVGGDTDNGKKRVCNKYVAIVGVPTDDFLPISHKNCQRTKKIILIISENNKDYFVQDDFITNEQILNKNTNIKTDFVRCFLS